MVKCTWMNVYIYEGFFSFHEQPSVSKKFFLITVFSTNLMLQQWDVIWTWWSSVWFSFSLIKKLIAFKTERLASTLFSINVIVTFSAFITTTLKSSHHWAIKLPLKQKCLKLLWRVLCSGICSCLVSIKRSKREPSGPLYKVTQASFFNF